MPGVESMAALTVGDCVDIPARGAVNRRELSRHDSNRLNRPRLIM
jgi:hypothetical protein